MYSYIAVAWDDNEAHADTRHEVATLQHEISALDGFIPVLSLPGIAIFHKPWRDSACGSYLLHDNGGVVLGTLFPWPAAAEEPGRLATIAAEDASKIVSTTGRYLVSRFWGRYVAFIRDSATNRFRVLRDPSGMLPCFHMAHGGVRIWFSRFADLSPLRLPLARLNWDYLEGHMLWGYLRSHETGLEGVAEVQAGELHDSCDARQPHRLLWDPAVICNTEVVEDGREAAQRLRATTKFTIDAWASAYSGILHMLSGGLDSSIVAVLLGQARTRTSVTCVNYFTAEPEGDERRYARLSAQKAGFALIEQQRNPRTVDFSAVLNICATPKPWHYGYHLEHESFEYDQARANGATATFTGGGGDGIFYRAQSGHSATDYLQRHRLSLRFFAIALNAARVEGKSLPAIFYGALAGRHSRMRQNWTADHAKSRTLISNELAVSQNASRWPLLEALGGADEIPIGKMWQILTTSIPPAFYNQLHNPLAVERIPPLVSQPIVELCLRIPTYVLVENGWDRAIARRAFAEDLPTPVVNRRGKGSMQLNVRAMFERNLCFIREFMLEGELVKRGYLNKEKLERCLGTARSLSGHGFSEVQDHLSTEAWIRNHLQSAAVAAPAWPARR